jgi:hypothetical protein
MTNRADADTHKTARNRGVREAGVGVEEKKSVPACVGGQGRIDRRAEATAAREEERSRALSQLHGAAAEQRIGVGGEVTRLLMAGWLWRAAAATRQRRSGKGASSRLGSVRACGRNETLLCWLSVPR